MQPPNEMRLAETQKPAGWKRLTLWVSLNRPLAWLAGLTIGLILFLAWLPAYVRLFFWHGLQSQRILVGMILGFGLLALSLLWSTGQRLDAWAFLLFNVRGRHPSWLDLLMSGVTQIGNGMAAVALALILFFAGLRLLAYELILGTLTLWLVVELVKALAHRGRPFIRLSQTRIVGQPAGGRSFPSGHTSQAFFMATLLAGYFHAGIWAVCLLYAIALLVGITRMYVGAHYPRDVLAGAILGSAWGLLGGIVFGYTV
jgi:membrane-associated phospholipid phosphatase